MTVNSIRRRFSWAALTALLLVIVQMVECFHSPYFIGKINYAGRTLVRGSDLNVPMGGWDDPEDEEYGSSQSNSGGRGMLNSASVQKSAEKSSHFFSTKGLENPSFRLDGKGELFDKLCHGMGVRRPSRIQNLAWPILLEGRHAIVADQTGSGKTLAYLVPLLQRALSNQRPKTPGTPSILVLAPTSELADQIRNVCQKLSTEVPFKTRVVTASGQFSTSIRDQIRMLQRDKVDVLISTPGRLSTILRTRNSGLDMSQLEAIVLDEVDVLLVDDETFGPQLRTISAAAPVESTQFVFVTATLPDSIVETVEREFAGRQSVAKIEGPGLHRVAPTVQEILIDVSVSQQFQRDPKISFQAKAEAFQTALRQHRCPRTLVFCNTVQSCRQVENLLKRSDRKGQIYHVGAYHNAMTPVARLENLKEFVKQVPTFSHGQRMMGKRNKDESNDDERILICTDRAARGVDFAAVDHVIIFDFPKDPAEYIRRAGRTARAGRGGTCTVFAYGWQLPIARRIMGKGRLDSKSIMSEMEEGNEEEKNGDEYRGGGAKRKPKLGSLTPDGTVKRNVKRQ